MMVEPAVWCCQKYLVFFFCGFELLEMPRTVGILLNRAASMEMLDDHMHLVVRSSCISHSNFLAQHFWPDESLDLFFSFLNGISQCVVQYPSNPSFPLGKFCIWRCLFCYERKCEQIGGFCRRQGWQNYFHKKGIAKYRYLFVLHRYDPPLCPFFNNGGRGRQKCLLGLCRRGQLCFWGFKFADSGHTVHGRHLALAAR